MKGKIKSAKGDSKKFWMYVKKLIPDIKGREINSVLDVNNNNAELFGIDSAYFINKYFCNIGRDLVSQIPVSAPPLARERT